MVSFKVGAGVATLIAAAGLAAMPLAALTMKECSAAYKSAQRSGALGGLSWQEFRKAKCGPQGGPGVGPGAGAGASTGLPPGGSAYLPGGRSVVLPGGRAVFPTGIAPKYDDETPGRGRRQTCLDQYRLNKASNANGGLRWIERAGGYYSECNKRLKTAPKN
jgi:hypothetical protein